MTGDGFLHLFHQGLPVLHGTVVCLNGPANSNPNITGANGQSILGYDLPASCDGNRNDGDFRFDRQSESSLLEGLDRAIRAS